MRKHLLCLSLFVFMAGSFTGCVGSQVPQSALHLPPESLANRQMQTRRFETANHQTMLSAAAAVLQDLGFTIEESEFKLGVLVGSKNRDATSGAQVAGAILVAALGGGSVPVDKEQTIRVSMVMRELPGAKGEQSQQKSKLTPQIVEKIKADVISAVSRGLQKTFPADVSARVAKQIAENTADTLAKDLGTLGQVRASSGQSTVRVTFQRVVVNTAGQITVAEQIHEATIYSDFFEKLSQSVFLEAHEI